MAHGATSKTRGKRDKKKVSRSLGGLVPSFGGAFFASDSYALRSALLQADHQTLSTSLTLCQTPVQRNTRAHQPSPAWCLILAMGILCPPTPLSPKEKRRHQTCGGAPDTEPPQCLNRLQADAQLSNQHHSSRQFNSRLSPPPQRHGLSSRGSPSFNGLGFPERVLHLRPGFRPVLLHALVEIVRGSDHLWEDEELEPQNLDHNSLGMVKGD